MFHLLVFFIFLFDTFACCPLDHSIFKESKFCDRLKHADEVMLDEDSDRKEDPVFYLCSILCFFRILKISSCNNSRNVDGIVLT